MIKRWDHAILDSSSFLFVTCGLGLNIPCCVGSPPHTGYEALNNGEASCGEDEAHSELDTPHMTLSQGSIAANWAHEPRQITQDTNGRSHHQPDPDCRPSIPTSALLLEKPTSNVSVPGSKLSSMSALKLE